MLFILSRAALAGYHGAIKRCSTQTATFFLENKNKMMPGGKMRA